MANEDLTRQLLAEIDQSGRLLAALKPYLRDREEKLLKRLIQAHIDGTLDEPTMRSGIAGIAELRALERHLVGDSALLRR